MCSDKAPIQVYFLSEESFSLFSGDFEHSRFGGAGLQMFFLGEEIGKDPDFQVNFVFFQHQVGKLKHMDINLINPRPMIKRGVPLVSRVINRRRRQAVYSATEERILFTTQAFFAPLGLQEANLAQAKSLFRVASDRDLTGSPTVPQEDWPKIERSIAAYDQIIVQSDYQKSIASQLGMEQVNVIPNGIPLMDAPDSNVDKDIILWVGSAQVCKRPWLFTSLVRAFPDEEFVMLIPPADLSLLELARQEGELLKNLTVITHQHTFEDSQRLFQRAKVFVNTSSYEGFPNTFLQAWSTKTPILSICVDPNQLIENKRLGIVAKGSWQDFVNSLQLLLTDDKLREKMGNDGFSYVQDYQNITVIAEQYKSVFRRMVDSGL